ncbi:Cysteine and histidine-rich protein 1 [Clonorchis sinensis]|uniref:Cysteine and histidine-rich protein 1 n=2 Tax=Clonorchis sinensis TaxID=79923 RepID=A0A8T1MFQ0_CLOSI|nr:Cysteine and histidine-rich protein 1 [Clonorchis sinensis]GAA54681.1 cysteine and histidine-rich protein 1 homolog [Clonorchis sinensis]
MRRIRRPYPHSSVRQSPSSRVYIEGCRITPNEINQNSSEIPLDQNVCSSSLPVDTTGINAMNYFVNGAPNNMSEGGIETANNTVEVFSPTNQEDTKYVRILRSIREVISCCACYSSDTIMKECTNGHLICQNCFLTLRQDERPQCPTCRASLYSDSRRALVAQKVLSELPDLCTDCNTSMLHKSLPSHRLNACPKRRVACGLSALGCDWTGCADEYDSHYHECNTRKQLTEQPVGANLEWLLSRFKKREQTMRETFHCFSNMLRHLESHELQMVTITLANVASGENTLLYRSDHFHVNQSRWTAEISMNLPGEQPGEQSQPEDQVSVTSDQVSTDATPDCADAPGLGNAANALLRPFVDSAGSLPTVAQQSSRRRRWHHGPSIRHHPYQLPIPPNTAGMHGSTAVLHEMPNTATQSADRTTDHDCLGEINYRMLKENSPGIGRRSYAFSLLQIRVPDTGIQIYARPQLQTFRFTNRGDHTSNFTVHPIRWRYISSLRELSKFRVVQAEVVIARRIVDDHLES